MDIWQTMGQERLELADDLEGLTPQQWTTPSLCKGWTVRHVAAHLVVPHEGVMTRFLAAFVRSGFSFDRANVRLTARAAERPTDEIVAGLRKAADSRFAPPGMGPIAPFTDVLVHGQDIRVPLGLADGRPPQPWAAVLDFLVSPKARRGFVRGRIPALRYVATDLDWANGEGPEVHGPAAALALAISGRSARVSELSGPGTDELTRWARG